jgi:hypothetical protein
MLLCGSQKIDLYQILMEYKIEIGEHCFGSIVRINDSDLFDELNDEFKLNDNNFKLIFLGRKNSINKFQKDELEHISEILQYRGDILFSLTEEEFELVAIL